MKSPNPTTERHDCTTQPSAPSDEQTGLPGLPTWPRVYLLVAGSFLLWVALLWGLSRMFA